MVQAVASSFSVFRNRNFSIYLGGQAISLIGTWLQVTAQGWVVWKLTGSTEDLGITTMLGTLPLLLLGPWAGAWADRYNRRNLLIVTQVSAMVLAFILAFLVLSDTVQLWHVYLLSLLLGIVTAVDFPTQQAFLGDLAGTGEVRKAVNMNIMIVQASRLVGPSLAGIIIANFGAGTTFLFNGLSFVAVVASLLLLQNTRLTRAAASSSSALRGFWEAFQFVIHQPELVDLLLFLGVLMFFGISTVANILPAVATDILHGDAALLGALLSASGAGALVGVVILAPWVQSLPRTGPILSIFMICMGLGFMLLSFSSVQLIALVAMFLASTAGPPVFTTIMGLLQVKAPDSMRARVVGLGVMISFGLQPLAALWIGWLAEPARLGIEHAIFLDSVLLLVGALIMLYRSTISKKAYA